MTSKLRIVLESSGLYPMYLFFVILYALHTEHTQYVDLHILSAQAVLYNCDCNNNSIVLSSYLIVLRYHYSHTSSMSRLSNYSSSILPILKKQLFQARNADALLKAQQQLPKISFVRNNIPFDLGHIKEYAGALILLHLYSNT